jgi:hypothetical protein
LTAAVWTSLGTCGQMPAHAGPALSYPYQRAALVGRDVAHHAASEAIASPAKSAIFDSAILSSYAFVSPKIDPAQVRDLLAKPGPRRAARHLLSL